MPDEVIADWLAVPARARPMVLLLARFKAREPRFRVPAATG
jgi:hypothetical protein